MAAASAHDIRLEIIDRRPRRPRGGPRLLFVHGIAVGAWIWDAYVLPYFAEAGFEAYAVSLRGHGGSDGHDRIHAWRLCDYVADLDAAAARIGGPLVAIGHSLGGAVVQDWVRAGARPRAMALLAAVPPWGLAVSALRMSLASPALFREVLTLSTRGVRHADPAILRAGLFSPDVPDAVFRRFLAQAGEESPLVGPELLGLPPRGPLPWQAPRSFVLGGTDDRFIPADEVWRTGVYYGVPPVLVPGLAHALMLETRWEAAAAALHDWLLDLG